MPFLFLFKQNGNLHIEQERVVLTSIYKCPPKVEHLDVYRVIHTININCTYIQRSFIMCLYFNYSENSFLSNYIYYYYI